MNSYYILLIVMLILIWAEHNKERKNAAVVNLRKKHKGKELLKMRELAEKFIGKDCLIYTIADGSATTNGVITEVTDCGLLVECEGDTQAVNLEYVTRIREWPKNSKGKKKIVFK